MADTKLIMGANYKRRDPGQYDAYCTCIGVKVLDNGRRIGYLMSGARPIEEVVEGGPELNTWTLVSVPVSAEVIDSLVDTQADILMRLEKLERQDKQVPSAIGDLATTQGRKRS